MRLSECEARERLLAAVSAADALPRGTAFEKVKGARAAPGGTLLRAAHGRRRAGEKRNGLRAPAQPTPEPDEEPAPEAPIKSEPAAPKPAAPKPAPAISIRAIQSLWRTLATERTPGNIEMYKLFRRLGSTISSADLQVIRRELWKFRKFMESHYKQFFGPCRLRVSVSTGLFCLTNLFAEVQARMYALLARGKKRKADELFHANTRRDRNCNDPKPKKRA